MNWDAFAISAVIFLMFSPIFYLIHMTYVDTKELGRDGEHHGVLFLGIVVLIFLLVMCYWIYEIESKRLGG